MERSIGINGGFNWMILNLYLGKIAPDPLKTELASISSLLCLTLKVPVKCASSFDATQATSRRRKIQVGRTREAEGEVVVVGVLSFFFIGVCSFQ